MAVNDEWGIGTTRVGRRLFKNGSDYYQPLMGLGLGEDARALDISACLNRRMLSADCSFTRLTAEVFHLYALDTQRPWGLGQPWAVTQRRLRLLGRQPPLSADEVEILSLEAPPQKALIEELVGAGYWLEAEAGFRLADSAELRAYWQWFDAEQRRRTLARRIPTEQRERILARDGNRCALCGSTIALVIDHIVPVAAGGGGEATNLRALCRSCNAGRNLPHPPHMPYPRRSAS